MENREYLWEEIYRPTKLSDCILPLNLKKQFKAFVEAGNLQNMLFYGPPGSGKTTVARVLCNELNADYKFINGSKDSGIDVLRNEVANYASSVSLIGGRKYVIFDEADYLNPNSAQPALRGMTEEFAENCSFIFTCNDIARIIKPLRDSRLAKFNFRFPKTEAPQLAGQFFERCKTILETENVSYEPKVLAELIKTYYPDFRQTLVELQRYSIAFGKIDNGILGSIDNAALKDLLPLIKGKKFNEARKWIGEHSELVYSNFYRSLYDLLLPHCDAENSATLVTIIGDYQYKAAFVADAEINAMACIAVIMAEIALK